MVNIHSLPRSLGDRKKEKAPNVASQRIILTRRFYSHSGVSKPEHLGECLQLVNYFIALANCSVVVRINLEIGYF